MSFPKKKPDEPIPKIQFTPAQIERMTMEQYAASREQIKQYMEAGGGRELLLHDEAWYHQYAHQPLGDGRRSSPTRSFMKPELEQRIIEWSRQDERVYVFWRMLTDHAGRISDGLNDSVIDGVMRSLSHLLKQWDLEKDQLNTRNLDNIRGLGNAAHSVVDAFEDAKARGDLEYMGAAVEELDAALYDLKQGETP